MVKLERLQSTPYGVTYIQPNGNQINYNWTGATDYARCIVEVDDVVYDWLKYNTVCFQKKHLVVVDEDKKEDVKSVLTEEEINEKIYTLEEIKKLFKASAKDFKAVVETLSDDQVREFINVAKKEKLDSSSKRAILAKKLKLPTEVLFIEEE